MACRRSGDKPLSEPMIVSLLTHICVTRPQWVKVVLVESEAETKNKCCCDWKLFSHRTSLKYVLCCLIANESAPVEVMAWCWTSDKPLLQQMMTQFTDACVFVRECFIPKLFFELLVCVLKHHHDSSYLYTSRYQSTFISFVLLHLFTYCRT